jgi:hypothetical protein
MEVDASESSELTLSKETRVPVLLVRHEVADHGTWIHEFHRNSGTRRMNGSHRELIFRITASRWKVNAFSPDIYPSRRKTDRNRMHRR